MQLKSIIKFILVVLLGMCWFLHAESDAKDKYKSNNAIKKDIVQEALKDELNRSMTILGEKGAPPPYFIGFRVTDNTQASVSATFGALRNSGIGRSRLLDVDVRVGDHKLDNTHPIRGRNFGSGSGYGSPLPITIEDDPDAIKNAIWLETDKEYKLAVEKIIQIKANKSVSVKEEDQSDDFSKENPQNYTEALATISPNLKEWEKRIKAYSALFNAHPDIFSANVSLGAIAQNKYFINSEGTTLRHGRTHWRISVTASTKAEDGMQLYKFESFDARTQGGLPNDAAINAEIKKLIKELLALRQAPLMEPYTGPAILSGKATAVFFHEIFGHRIEGHRQKDEKEGQTFTKQINKEVLPTFISVFDDPTMKQYANIDLNGHYLYDEEGVKSQRVDLVDNGVLRNFLMSRSPITGFSQSNGHGRSQSGKKPVSRQGVLVVQSKLTVAMKELRQKLLAECKKQGKPYGLYFEDISGGFTFTQRYMPQAFNVTPIMVYRVFVDGRPDELVRGVDLIGTPLTSFSKIIACGSEPGIFNGYCGAESGTVPASAISPAVLTTQIEVQKKRKSSNKPPVLAPPVRRSK
jgi:TldD protein